MSNQFSGQVVRSAFRKWQPVHYCCPGHTPHWKGRVRNGRIRSRQKSALLRDLQELRNDGNTDVDRGQL